MLKHGSDKREARIYPKLNYKPSGNEQALKHDDKATALCLPGTTIKQDEAAKLSCRLIKEEHLRLACMDAEKAGRVVVQRRQMRRTHGNVTGNVTGICICPDNSMPTICLDDELLAAALADLEAHDQGGPLVTLRQHLVAAQRNADTPHAQTQPTSPKSTTLRTYVSKFKAAATRRSTLVPLPSPAESIYMLNVEKQPGRRPQAHMDLIHSSDSCDSGMALERFGTPTTMSDAIFKSSALTYFVSSSRASTVASIAFVTFVAALTMPF
ncbi:hypothetical protein C8R45DRAFT_939053 [Mycena sanguinolenta]|nr:hypothetical protein C8R45DRAFT_939053 [Mycena sanguinolenta]